MVAVRDGALSGIENRSSPPEAAKASKAFREDVFRIFSRAGAVMTGFEGDLAMFALGSPQERQAMKRMKALRPYDDGDGSDGNSPAGRAAELVLEIVGTIKDGNTPQAQFWRFAIDTGECCFSWSPAAGLSASGRAVVSARLFSNLCSRYKTRILVSGRVAEKLEAIPAISPKKLGILVDDESGEREEFYALGDETEG
jgi:class 3 adenylate cyclase